MVVSVLQSELPVLQATSVGSKVPCVELQEVSLDCIVAILLYHSMWNCYLRPLVVWFRFLSAFLPTFSRARSPHRLWYELPLFVDELCGRTLLWRFVLWFWCVGYSSLQFHQLLAILEKLSSWLTILTASPSTSKVSYDTEAQQVGWLTAHIMSRIHCSTFPWNSGIIIIIILIICYYVLLLLSSHGNQAQHEQLDQKSSCSSLACNAFS